MINYIVQQHSNKAKLIQYSSIHFDHNNLKVQPNPLYIDTTSKKDEAFVND